MYMFADWQLHFFLLIGEALDLPVREGGEREGKTEERN